MPSEKPWSESRALWTALAGGALIWVGIGLISGRAEAWDSPLYWQVGYPLSLLLAGWLGYRCPLRTWRWGLAVLLVQPVVMVLTSGSGFGLLPLGLILFAVLALPAVVVARLGGSVSRRPE